MRARLCNFQMYSCLFTLHRIFILHSWQLICCHTEEVTLLKSTTLSLSHYAKFASNLWCSRDTSTPQMVTHPSTNHARHCFAPIMDLVNDARMGVCCLELLNQISLLRFGFGFVFFYKTLWEICNSFSFKSCFPYVKISNLL